MVTQVKTLGLTLIAAAALVACGGGGTSAPTAASSSALSGTVIDGAIKGANVCLDLNSNLNCDSGEPSAVSQSGGSYTLDTSGLTAAQIKSAHVFVTVPLTATDADDGDKNLEQAGKAAFSMLAPAESAVSSTGQVSGSVVVSPITTLVSHEMLLDGKDADTAKGIVKNKLGIADSADLNQNFVGKTDDTNKDLAKKAQFLAAALGEVVKKIATDAPSTTAKERLLGALDHLRTSNNAKDLVDADDTGKTPVQAIQAALQQDALKPVTATLVTNAQSTVNNSPVIDASTTGFDSIIPEGFYEGYCAESSTDTMNGSSMSTCHKWHFTAIKGAGAGQWQSTKYAIKANETAFTQVVPDSAHNEYALVDGAGWVSRNINPKTGTYAADSTGLVSVTRKLSDSVSIPFGKMRMVSKDVSGKKFSELKEVNIIKEILQFFPALSDTPMPSGATMILSTSEYDRDAYGLGHSQVALNNCSSNPCTTTPLTSFGDLLSAYATPTGTDAPSNRNWFWTSGSSSSSSSSSYNGPWYFGTFDAEGQSAQGGTMSVWRSENGKPDVKLDEKTSYTIKTVAGEKLLVINPSATALVLRRQRTGTTTGWEQLFAVRDGKLYSGSYGSVQARNQEPGDSQWNKTAAEAVVKAMGASALPQ